MWMDVKVSSDSAWLQGFACSFLFEEHTWKWRSGNAPHCRSEIYREAFGTSKALNTTIFLEDFLLFVLIWPSWGLVTAALDTECPDKWELFWLASLLLTQTPLRTFQENNLHRKQHGLGLCLPCAPGALALLHWITHSSIYTCVS